MSSSTTLRVAYCVKIKAPDPEDKFSVIDWIETLERMERFAESYGNEDRTVPPSNSLFALAAQALATTDNEDLHVALPNATKEYVERIREIYPIVVTTNYDSDQEDDIRESHPRSWTRYAVVMTTALSSLVLDMQRSVNSLYKPS